MYQSLIKNGKKRTATKEKNRNITTLDSGQEYAIIKSLLGNGRTMVLCEDNIERMGRIRGSMRHHSKKTLVDKGDLVIISKRDYEEDKVDICHKFNYDETCKIIKDKTFPINIVKAWKTGEGKEDDEHINDNFAFQENDEPISEDKQNTTSYQDIIDDL
jgi:translation initiation factor 1A